MVITKSGDVTKQGFCKMLWREREGLFITYYLFFEFVWEGVGWGWALINFSAFRMGANSRLGAYSNKYGIQLERRALLALYWTAGTDLVVLTFQLLLDCNFFFFLVFFLLFFLCHFLLYFLDLFFDSPPSLTHLSPPLPRRAPSAPDKRERPFCFAPDHYLDYSAFLAYAKSTGCFLAWKTLHWLTF